MEETPDNKPAAAASGEPPKFNWRLEEGVAYFEQMLEVMPEDRTTLEFLDVAYEQMGQLEKSKKALTSLVKLLIRERDVSALKALVPRMEASDYPPLQALLLKTNALIAPPPDLTPEVPKELTKEELAVVATRDAVASELALSEAWHAAGILDEEAMANLRAHLEATPADGRLFLISALQILEKENMSLCERCAEHMADMCGAPPVPLGAYEVNRKLIERYPEALVRQRGVVPFAEIGGTTLVAVLNAADRKLKEDVAAVGACRFFVADPAAVEAAVDRVYGGEQ